MLHLACFFKYKTKANVAYMILVDVTIKRITEEYEEVKQLHQLQ
jgi:hypothetical protein